LFNKIENSNICVIIHGITMLILDLLNTLFDQANYETLMTLRCINKRKTKYANKYSVLSYYDVKNVTLNEICDYGTEPKTTVHLASRGVINIDFALQWSAEHGKIYAVKYLVSIGANIHADDDYALQWSAVYGHLDVVKYLASMGANIHADGEYALQWSAGNGYLDVVKYLVSIGANVHANDDYALRRSAKYGEISVVKYLVSVGANIHADGDFALIWSANNGHLEVVKYLVSEGANINIDDGDLFGIEMIRRNFSHLRST